MTGSPALLRTTVAASGPWSAPPKTNEPLASISASRVATRSIKRCISSGVGGAPGAASSPAYVDSKYWFMIAPHIGAGRSRIHPTYEWDRSTRTPTPGQTLEHADDLPPAALWHGCNYT